MRGFVFIEGIIVTGCLTVVIVLVLAGAAGLLGKSEMFGDGLALMFCVCANFMLVNVACDRNDFYKYPGSLDAWVQAHPYWRTIGHGLSVFSLALLYTATAYLLWGSFRPSIVLGVSAYAAFFIYCALHGLFEVITEGLDSSPWPEPERPEYWARIRPEPFDRALATLVAMPIPACSLAVVAAAGVTQGLRVGAGGVALLALFGVPLWLYARKLYAGFAWAELELAPGSAQLLMHRRLGALHLHRGQGSLPQLKLLSQLDSSTFVVELNGRRRVVEKVGSELQAALSH